NPNHVSINEKRKHIDADTTWLDKRQKEVQKISLDASNAERVLLQLLGSGKELSASAKGNIAVAETSDGQRAQVQKIGDKGGIATAGGHKAQLRTSDAPGEKHAFLKADGQYDLDTVAKGSLKNAEDTVFEAHNDKFDFGLDPKSQNNDSGAGDLSYFDKEKNKKGDYSYTISKQGGKTSATLEQGASSGPVGDFAESLFGRRSDKYHCTAETPGVSQCYDGQGKSVGKVVADKNGNTVVYNDKDVPIGTGTVKKTGPRSFEAVISKNLFIARMKDVKSAACCKEITGKNCTAPIKLANPSFNSPSDRDGETVHLTWPSCFDMGIDVTLPPGVHIERLAMKLDVSIQPIGKLRCMDVATCGRECFYCDWCKESRKLKLLEGSEGNLCRATGLRTYRLTVRLCPPPEDPEFTMCSAFSKSVWQKDYWQKEGAVDVWMKFFERSDSRPELEKEFFSQIDNPLLGKAFKLAIIAEWLAANSLDQGSYTPTNSELLEFWVSKRSPDTLLACHHAVVDYELEGAKVKTNVLFEAATTAGNFPNILKDKKCAAFENLQENRFQQEAAEYKRKGGGGLFSGFQSFLNSAQQAVKG
ncbi:hypothetical protein PFISCL1PPCAC_6285, partial [Pristionchus fissidentatus]